MIIKNLGHTQLCKKITTDGNYYLPHHGVFQEDNIRVVLNASTSTTNNVSINDTLHSGTKLHNFRMYKVAFS